MGRNLKQVIFPLLLALIAVILSIQNYTPGTILSGWDTIHPEFNFSEYFKRIFNVWQQHQGLGAVASQAHASELPRLIIYYLFSFILPLNFLRYSFFFLCLIIGPLGVYFFVKEILLKDRKDNLTTKVSAFVAGLYYLLNLATLQHFFVPLEMFALHFATIGWIFLFASKFLLTGKSNFLALFGLVIIFSSAVAHTATLFYIFALMFILFLLTYSLTTFKKIHKRVLLIIFFLFTLNLYWILPNLYYLKNYGESVATSKIHSEFSDRAFEVSKNFGNLRDTALLKNFLFDWGQYDEKNGKFVYLLSNWETHLKNPRVNLIGLILFFLSIVGMFFAIKQREKIAISLIPIFLISIIFIANDNIVFEKIYNFFEANFPLVKEGLRFPFTKFSILLAFTICSFLGFALSFLISKALNLAKNVHLQLGEKFLATFFLLIFSLSIIYFALPAFSGNFIDYKMRTKIPQEYFDLYNFFNSQNENERIAPFPVHSFWGWVYYKWGYEGAGFNWFGIKQPLLDREFDRWSPYNENYYWEISLATYSDNSELFEKILEKYQITWLIIDPNVIDTSSAQSTYLDRIEALIASSDKFKLEGNFKDIKVYKFHNPTKVNDFVTLINNLPFISPKYDRNNFDQGFLNYGNYGVSQIKTNELWDIYFPFRSLFTNYKQRDLEFEIEEDEKFIIFKKEIPSEYLNYTLYTPDIRDYENIQYFSNDLESTGYITPTISFNGRVLVVRIPKIPSLYSNIINPAKEQIEIKNCDSLRESRKTKVKSIVDSRIEEEAGREFLRLKSTLANNCGAHFSLPNMPHDLGFLISIESRNIKGKSLLFFLENSDIKKAEIETYLSGSNEWSKSYFIKPPLDKSNLGYLLNFQEWSFNKEESINDLSTIEVNPIPFNYLTSIALQKNSIIPQGENKVEEIDASHPGTGLYKIKLPSNKTFNSNDTLVLFQSFDRGWTLLELKGLSFKPLGTHVLINNWANGWVLDSKVTESTLYIIFIPQLLHTLGLVLLALGIFMLAVPRIGKRDII